jgi:hypothetical protein
MTLYEFNALDEMGQAKAIWNSIHIGERRDAENNIILYQKDDFYIEVFHHKKLNVIRKIRSFLSISQLDPYLGSIDISEVF